jgi:hypothetical protein
MKTAESHIKEKIGKFVVDYAVSQVNQWAKQELNYIRYALDYPVVVPVNDSYWVISNYHIKHFGTHRYKVTTDGKEIHTFYSKKAAVFYVVLTKLHYYNTADGIINEDRIVAKYHDELELYRSKLVNNKKADSFKFQLWQTRYFETKNKFVVAKQKLEKRLNSAKYNKVWDYIL